MPGRLHLNHIISNQRAEKFRRKQGQFESSKLLQKIRFDAILFGRRSFRNRWFCCIVYEWIEIITTDSCFRYFVGTSGRSGRESLGQFLFLAVNGRCKVVVSYRVKNFDLCLVFEQGFTGSLFFPLGPQRIWLVNCGFSKPFWQTSLSLGRDCY